MKMDQIITFLDFITTYFCISTYFEASLFMSSQKLSRHGKKLPWASKQGFEIEVSWFIIRNAKLKVIIH